MFLSLAVFPMMLLSLLHVQRLQNKLYEFKYSNSRLLAIVGFVFLLIINFNNISWNNFSFLMDFKFYLTQIVGTTFMILQIKSRKANENNLTVCYFVNFATIAIIPLVSMIAYYLFEFNNTIEISYDNQYNIYILSAILLILSGIFYADKMKNKSVNNIGLLFAVFIIGAFSSVLGVKMIQEYHPISYMMVSTFSNIIIFSIVLLFKERKKIDRPIDSLMNNKNLYAALCISYCLTMILNMIIATNLASEHYAIIKSVGIIFANYGYTYYMEKVNLFNRRDSFILTLIIITLLYFTI